MFVAKYLRHLGIRVKVKLHAEKQKQIGSCFALTVDGHIFKPKMIQVICICPWSQKHFHIKSCHHYRTNVSALNRNVVCTS